jgi:VWFA-related protein
MMREALFCVVRQGFFVVLALFAISAGAQTIPPQEPYRFRVDVSVVNVEVSVTDARGNFVPGFARENFRVLDDGVPQIITHFAAVEAPARILVLVETSPAVYLIHKQHLQAAFAMFAGLAADDEVAIGTYDRTAHRKQDFTANKDAAYAALLRLQFSLGSTELNFYDSVGSALEWLEVAPGRKAIVLLSTGLDTSAPARWNALSERLRSAEAVIYPIALGGELRDYKPGVPAEKSAVRLSFEQTGRRLEELAELTGGRAFFPRRAEDFPGIFQQVATALRHQYTLGFAPPARDGRLHRIEVYLVDGLGRPLNQPNRKPLYTVRARPAYRAPEQ